MSFVCTARLLSAKKLSYLQSSMYCCPQWEHCSSSYSFPYGSPDNKNQQISILVFFLSTGIIFQTSILKMEPKLEFGFIFKMRR